MMNSNSMEQTGTALFAPARAIEPGIFGAEIVRSNPAGTGMGVSLPASFKVWPFDEQYTFPVFQPAGHER
jgi:hypothetical protein